MWSSKGDKTKTRRVYNPRVLFALAFALSGLSITRSSGRRPRCVYCHEDIYEAPLICTSCRVMVHPECRVELLRCPTMGCKGSFDAPEPKPPVLREREDSAAAKIIIAAAIMMAVAAAVLGILAVAHFIGG